MLEQCNQDWRILGYQWSESVKAVIHGLGRVSVKFQLLLHRVKFDERLYFKSDLLHNVFWVYLLTVYLFTDTDDSCCRTVFLPHYTLPSIIYCYSFMNM